VGAVAARRISPDAGRAALSRYLAGDVDKETEAEAVRYTLQLLKDKAPGRSVEVRVPPWGAVQVIEGPAHTRGTPPAVVEMDPSVWVKLALGTQTFSEALAEGGVRASGVRSDLTGWLPVIELI
jgi:hypothetical protein